MGTIRDGMFVLVSLLLGFTLTLAAARFTERRSLLVEEAISIGTTYLRAGTLPQPFREHSRQLLREYVDARLALTDVSGDPGRHGRGSEAFEASAGRALVGRRCRRAK